MLVRFVGRPFPGASRDGYMGSLQDFGDESWIVDMVVERAEQSGTLAVPKFGHGSGKLLKAEFYVGVLLKDLGGILRVETVRDERATIIDFAFFVECQR